MLQQKPAPRKVFIHSINNSHLDIPKRLWIQGFVVDKSYEQCTIHDGTGSCIVTFDASHEISLGMYILVIGVLKKEQPNLVQKQIEAHQCIDLSKQHNRVPGWWLEVQASRTNASLD